MEIKFLKRFIPFFILIILFGGCQSDEVDGRYEILKEKFHGKYEIISSVSEDKVDLNMDNLSSTDLFQENPEIERGKLNLIILDPSNVVLDNDYLLYLYWPVETIVIPRGEVFDSAAYHSDYSVFYAQYINSSKIQFTENDESIVWLDSIQTNKENTLIKIESINIEKNEIINVELIRKIYTKKGWVNTKISSRYKRYTKDT